MGAPGPEGARGRGRGGGEVLKGIEKTSSREGSDGAVDLGMGMLDARDVLPAMVGIRSKGRRFAVANETITVQAGSSSG